VSVFGYVLSRKPGETESMSGVGTSSNVSCYKRLPTLS